MMFGRALFIARRDRSLSQRALARLAGVHASTISYIERGEISPSTATMRMLAKGLDCELEITFRPRDAAKDST